MCAILLTRRLTFSVPKYIYKYIVSYQYILSFKMKLIIIKFKVNQLLTVLLLGLIIVTVLIPPMSCQQQRRHRVRGHHHGRTQMERHHKRSTNKYLCEETEEDVQRLNERITTSCKCPSTYAPVCGSDGKTWHNRCFIHCAAQEKYQRFHHGRTLTIVKMEPCGFDH